MLNLMVWVSGLHAQPRNPALLGQLALACVDTLPDPRVVLEAPHLPPYITATLLESWQAQGREVWTEPVDTLPRLTLLPEAIRLQYRRLPGKRVERRAEVVLKMLYTEASGRVRYATTCRKTYRDTLALHRLADMGHPAFPETNPPIPEGRWERLLRPLIWSTAAVLSVYLLFAVRSKSRDT